MGTRIAKALLAIGLCAPSLSAQFGPFYDAHCLAITNLELELEFPIVPGCELIGCCPECPGPWPIRWEVKTRTDDRHVKGKHDNLTKLEFRFQNLSKDAWSGLRVSGGDWNAANTALTISGSQATIYGFRDPGEDQRLPSAQLVLNFDKSSTQEFLQLNPAPAGLPPDTVPTRTITIEIQQLIDRHLVNRISWEVEIFPCGDVGATFDEIQLQGFDAQHGNAIAQVDGERPSGVCLDDSQHSDVSPIRIPNLVSPTQCRSEVAIYSPDNAFALIEDITTWTAASDVLSVPLASLVEVPVRFWVLDPSPAVKADIETQLGLANEAYCKHRAGIRFSALPPIDLTSDPGELLKYKLSMRDFCDRAALSPYFERDLLNVYYIPEGKLDDGAPLGFFSTDHGNIIVIRYQEAPERTLAHEFGHALGLKHTHVLKPDVFNEGNPGYDKTHGMPDSNNLMFSAGEWDLTLGQVFRANVDSCSIINRYGWRTGPTRRCPHYLGDPTCPLENVQFKFANATCPAASQ